MQTPLKSCMSTQRHQRKSNKVMFGPAKAAEFDSSEPVYSMTPMNQVAVESQYNMEKDDSESSESSESADTANNSRVLAQWGEETESRTRSQGSRRNSFGRKSVSRQSPTQSEANQKQKRESSVGPLDLQTLLKEEHTGTLEDFEISFKGTPTHKMSRQQMEKLSDVKKSYRSLDNGEEQTRTLEDLQKLLQECNDDEDDDDNYSTESEHSSKKKSPEAKVDAKNDPQQTSQQQQQETPKTNGEEAPSPQQSHTSSDGETDDELQTFREQEDQLLMSFNITPQKRSRSSSRRRSYTAGSCTSNQSQKSQKRRKSFQPPSTHQLLQEALKNESMHDHLQFPSKNDIFEEREPYTCLLSSAKLLDSFRQHRYSLQWKEMYWQYRTNVDRQLVNWKIEILNVQSSSEDWFALLEKSCVNNKWINVQPSTEEEQKEAVNTLRGLKRQAHEIVGQRLEKWKRKSEYSWERNIGNARASIERKREGLEERINDFNHLEGQLKEKIRQHIQEKKNMLVQDTIDINSEIEGRHEYSKEKDSQAKELDDSISSVEARISAKETKLKEKHNTHSQWDDEMKQYVQKAAVARARAIAICYSSGWAPQGLTSLNVKTMTWIPNYFGEEAKCFIYATVPMKPFSDSIAGVTPEIHLDTDSHECSSNSKRGFLQHFLRKLCSVRHDSVTRFSKSLVSFQTLTAALSKLESEFEVVYTIPAPGSGSHLPEVSVFISSRASRRKLELIVPAKVIHSRVGFVLDSCRFVQHIGSMNVSKEDISTHQDLYGVVQQLSQWIHQPY